MEVLFKNTYIRNKELAKELYGYLLFRRSFAIIGYALLIISFIGSVLIALIEGWYNTFVLIFVPVFFALRIWSYYRYVETFVKRDQEQYGREVEVINTVTDQYVQCTAENSFNIKLEYDNIKYVVDTKSLILLYSKAKLIYAFQKNSFSIGTKDAFIAFLKSKGIKVK